MPISNVVIREATEADIPVLMDLISQLAEYERARVKITKEQLLKFGFREPRRFYVLLAFVDGMPLGYSIYEFCFNSYEGLYVFMEDLFVCDKARGYGLGVELVKKVVQIAHKNECAKVQWQVMDWNEPAIKFYERRLGAHEVVEHGNEKWLTYKLDSSRFQQVIAS